MSLDQLSNTDSQKLKDFMTQGLSVLQDIADLRDGLKDTAKNLAEELGVKPAVLNKALTTAFKSSLEDQKEVMDQVESVLISTGRA
jgi:DNA-binding SARP family transcriptional activator